MSLAAAAILGFVTAERLAELLLARTNTQRLLAQGAREHGGGALPADRRGPRGVAGDFVAAGVGPAGRDAVAAVFALLTAARLWVIATLGRRWTTRIIVLPQEPLVAKGPYRLVNHPNYWVVAGEIAVLPLVFGLPWVALVFTILNAAVLAIRIRAEERALNRKA